MIGIQCNPSPCVHSISRSQPLHKIITTLDALVLLTLLSRKSAWKSLDVALKVGVAKVPSTLSVKLTDFLTLILTRCCIVVGKSQTPSAVALQLCGWCS